MKIRAEIEETKRVLGALLTVFTYEKIATLTGKSYYTIWRWAHGKGAPDPANMELLRVIARQKGLVA